MRYEKGRKADTHKKIMDVASRLFKRHGISATGVASIMGDAGLTNGAFYAHFESKNDLLRHALETSWDELHQQTKQVVEDDGLETVLRNYLSEAHRDHPGEGCLSAALLPEIARHADDVRRSYTAKFNNFIDLVSRYLPEPGSANAQSTARAMFGLAMGSIQLARAVDDPVLSSEILDGALSASLKMMRSPAP